MRRILVIGAKGMLGRDLVKILHSTFHTHQDPNREILEWDIDEIDIREEKKTVNKIESFRPEIVINVAAYTDVDGCESNEEKAFAVNAEGMKHVALGALRCRAKVVYLSTDYIFGGKKREPYLEDEPPNPLNVYGRSKWKGEQYVRELVKDVLIVRTQWLYGRYGNNFVTSILRQAREKKVLSIVNDQIGSPTYTVDLSEAISVLLQCDARGVFHVANSDLCSWYTFGQTILKLSGMERVKVIPISSKELGRPAIRHAYSVLHCQKLKQVTGMTLRPWSGALRDFLLPVHRPTA
ncbi:MAG: dTDP-4-dehydrorhamnose reductase [Desulfobacterales bacterium]|nr:dTDP-4-dehydrorhamnose reductase [Desulfobacterales bacterium]